MLSLDIDDFCRGAAPADAGAPQAGKTTDSLTSKNWHNPLKRANLRHSTVSKACVNQINRRGAVAARPGNEESRRPQCPRPLSLPLQLRSAWPFLLAATRIGRKNSPSSSRFSRSTRSRLPARNTADRYQRGVTLQAGRATALSFVVCAVSGREAFPC